MVDGGSWRFGVVEWRGHVSCMYSGGFRIPVMIRLTLASYWIIHVYTSTIT